MAEYIDQYNEESSTGKEKIKEAVKVKTTSSITLSNPVKPLKVEDVTEGNNDIIIPVSASCVPINPSLLTETGDGFELQDQEIIPSENITGSFVPGENIVEFFVYDADKNLASVNYNFTNWTLGKNSENALLTGSYTDSQTGENVVVENPPTSSVTNAIELNPTANAFNLGFDAGQVFTAYNFINYELGSSIENTFYIAEISGDRTEIAIKSNFISKEEILSSYTSLKESLNSSNNFDEFYISLFNNDYQIAVNCILDESGEEPRVLVKLYDALPAQFSVKDELYVATKVGESVAYKINYIEDVQTFIDNATYIKGPNINISLQDLVNNSTTLKSRNDLIETNSTSSLNQVLNILNQRGVAITPNYSYDTFDQFVNFSSAKERINNFYEKVSQIQAYEADIESITAITGSNPNVTAISQSLASLETNISNLIQNFDGYETYLYYNTSSLYAYPKTGSAYPFDLLPTGSTEVLEWLGSDVEGSQYYGGIILSASLYDENNQNWLYYTIPQYIVENSENENYVTFANMVGQSFDEVWIYTKALSERYNTTNNPDEGLPLGLAADAIKGLGFETFGNNYNNQGNFIGLAGEDNGSYVPPTGSELITQYIAVNSGSVVNYWDPGYSWEDYVESINNPGFPYAIDKVSKEIYKRLFHNMAYLTKKKGTVSGLRQLINIWGIPNTILRIDEFGGKNRDNSNDYDLWYNRFSYAYTPVATQYLASSSVLVPWMPLERNFIANVNEDGDNEFIVPDGVGVRFKTTGFPSSSFAGTNFSQSILSKKSNGLEDNKVDWAISLQYDEQPSGSYSGSSFSDYYEYGNLSFYLSGSESEGGTIQSPKIFLPFFNKGWWTVLLQRDQHVSQSLNTSATTYTLFAANNQYNGDDGNTIGWTGSASITISNPGASSSLNESWNAFGVGDPNGVYVGGYISGSNVGTVKSGSGGTDGFTAITNPASKIFSGSFQEFRYYSNAISESVFHDFAMNPESVEGNAITGSQSSFDIVNFRAPLGNELEQLYTSSGSDPYTVEISSSHPAITGSAPLVITGSFINPANFTVTSSYNWIIYYNANTRTYSKPNYEVYQLDQPAIGIRNRVSNKIQVEDGDAYGNVLSRQISIDQNYLISQSYTEDTNNLEVGFSPQNEVNDDIIATYGHGVISDAIADPRNVTSSLPYYPKLRETAEDYFKKYTQGNVWDYIRLIKYFDNSLFKAIKSYVPARTSVTTGVIIKQHMLERNRRPAVQITPDSTIAYGVSGSFVTSSADTGAIYGTGVYGTGVYGTEGTDTQWGANTLNVAQVFRNLELNANIPEGSYSGTIESFSGSPAFYSTPVDFTYFTASGTVSITGSTSQIPLSNSGSFFYSSSTPSSPFPEGEIQNFIQAGYQMTGSLSRVSMDLNNVYIHPLGSSEGDPGGCFLSTTKHIKSKVQWNATRIADGADLTGRFQITSSERGVIYNQVTPNLINPTTISHTSSLLEFFPEEQLYFNLMIEGAEVEFTNMFLRFGNLEDENSGSIGEYQGDPVSQQGWFDKYETISGSVLEWNGYQEQFFNGEYSGSEIIAMTQSLLNNPYARESSPDTTYHMIVDADIGHDPLGDNSDPLDYGIQLQIYSSDNYTAASKKLQTVYSNLGPTTGAISTFPSTTDPENYFIAQLLLPNFVIQDPGGVRTPVIINQGEIRSSELVPLPSFKDGEIYSTWTTLEDGRYGFNQTNPWIAGETITSKNAAYTIQDSGLLGNLNSGIIHSGYLGRTETVKRKFGKFGVGIFSDPGAGDVSGSTLYEFKEPSLNKGRPIVLNQAPTGGVADFPKILGNPDNPLVPNYYYVDWQFRFSEFQTKRQQILDTAATASFDVGTGSMYLLGTSFTSSFFHDVGSLIPVAALFNVNSIDSQGNYINNESTLLNNPQFTYTLVDLSGSGTAATEDAFGLAGNLFDQSRNVVDGIISNNANSMIGYAYNINFNGIGVSGSNGSRPLSGSFYNVEGDVNDYGFLPQTTQSSRYIPFDPTLPNETEFYNTAFNPLINNATSSVKNTYIMKVEYDDGSVIPSNIIPIIDRSAQKANTPDSNYTTTRIINPRYVGSRIQSANYNFFTPSTSSITFLNALSGSSTSQSSWQGDDSYGSQAVINKNPIYFARFKSSYNNLNLPGTYTFEIESLILSPTSSILGTKAPETPVTIKVDGSGNNLTEVRSTFEVDRKVAIAYDSLKFNTIDYGKLKTGDNVIFQGSLEMPTIGASTTGENGPTDQYSYPTFAPTMSFQTASWVTAGAGNLTNYENISASAANGALGSNAGYMVTGSKCLFLKGEGSYAQAPMYSVSSGGGNDSYVQYISGPGLGVLNSLNTAVSESNDAELDDESGTELVAPGIPTSLSTSFSENPSLSEKSIYYWRQDFSSSGMAGYRESEGALPFIIKVNDEIECTFNDNTVYGATAADPNYKTMTFIVTGISGSFGESGTDVGQYSASYCDDSQCFATRPWSNANNVLRNAIQVYPDPSRQNVIGGQIGSFKIRRRVNADDRVIVYQTPPTTFGVGATTGSGGGFLIPNDFTPQQKRNALTLINQLKQKNSFRDDSELPDPIP
tara:strand:- start:1130 stop:8809 length:7680 start_codon:yes stop_codon:yes gene_type:complete